MKEGVADRFVTTEYINPLSDRMLDAHNRVSSNRRSGMTDEEFEEIAERQREKVRDMKMSHTVTDDILERGKVSRRIRDNLKSTGIDEDELIVISNRISYAITEELGEKLDEIKSTIEDGDPNRIQRLSRILLTGIVGKFVDEFLNIMSEFSAEIMNAIVEVVKTAFV